MLRETRSGVLYCVVLFATLQHAHKKYKRTRVTLSVYHKLFKMSVESKSQCMWRPCLKSKHHFWQERCLIYHPGNDCYLIWCSLQNHAKCSSSADSVKSIVICGKFSRIHCFASHFAWPLYIASAGKAFVMGRLPQACPGPCFSLHRRPVCVPISF